MHHLPSTTFERSTCQTKNPSRSNPLRSRQNVTSMHNCQRINSKHALEPTVIKSFHYTSRAQEKQAPGEALFTRALIIQGVKALPRISRNSLTRATRSHRTISCAARLLLANHPYQHRTQDPRAVYIRRCPRGAKYCRAMPSLALISRATSDPKAAAR